MKKLILCFLLVGAFLVNAQTIHLSPLELGGTYVQHISGDETITVSKIPEWKRTTKPYLIGNSLLTFEYVKEYTNWIEIRAKDFSSDGYYSLSKDSAGNAWIVYTPYKSAKPQLFAILDCKIKTIEDVVGCYWVSWKLIEGTRDIYPILHKE